MGSSPPPCSFNSRVSSLSSSLFLQFKSVLLLLLLVPSIQECPPSPPSCSFNSRVSCFSSSLFLQFKSVLLLLLLVPSFQEGPPSHPPCSNSRDWSSVCFQSLCNFTASLPTKNGSARGGCACE